MILSMLIVCKRERGCLRFEFWNLEGMSEMQALTANDQLRLEI